MPLPDYDRPFEASECHTSLTWTESLSHELGSNLYHACHENDLRRILAAEMVPLRSSWKIKLTNGKCIKRSGVWCGLNSFNADDGNRYGPFLIHLSLDALVGRSFLVFKRHADRHRYFFVEYDEEILKVFRFAEGAARTVSGRKYFSEDPRGSLSLKHRAIYDLVLIDPLPLADSLACAVRHNRCISSKCCGMDLQDAQDLLLRLVNNRIRPSSKSDFEYEALRARFPDLPRRHPRRS